jgi:hypothetical protein
MESFLDACGISKRRKAARRCVTVARSFLMFIACRYVNLSLGLKLKWVGVFPRAWFG